MPFSTALFRCHTTYTLFERWKFARVVTPFVIKTGGTRHKANWECVKFVNICGFYDVTGNSELDSRAIHWSHQAEADVDLVLSFSNCKLSLTALDENWSSIYPIQHLRNKAHKELTSSNEWNLKTLSESKDCDFTSLFGPSWMNR